MPVGMAGGDHNRAFGQIALARSQITGAHEILHRDLGGAGCRRRPRPPGGRPGPARLSAIHMGGIVAHTFDRFALLGGRLAQQLPFFQFAVEDFGKIGPPQHVA